MAELFKHAAKYREELMAPPKPRGRPKKAVSITVPLDADEIQRRIEELEKKEYTLLKKVENYEDSNRINFFKPHPKQEGYFGAVRDASKKVIIFQGGNRSGKTTSLIVALISLMLGKLPWDKDGKNLRYKPPIRARLFGEDWTHHVGQVLIPELKKWMPAREVKATKKNNQGIDYYWQLANGSVLEIMTYEQSTDQVEGWSGHVVACDEPMPRDKYIANKRGLVDFDGVYLMSFTPLKEPWIKDELIDNPDSSIATFFVDTDDNPYLSKAAIEEFKKSLTPDEVAARLRGQWMHLQGLVYKEFDKNLHWIEPFKLTDNFTISCAIDTHPRTEQAVSFMAVDKRGMYYIVKEIFEHGRPEDIVDWIIEFHEKTHKVHRVLIDPSSQGDQNRGDSTYDIISKGLSKKGIVLDKGSKDLDSGIMVVKEALKSRNGLPSLFIFNTCPRHLYEFSHYIWDEWKTDGKTERNKPRDKDDHMLENLRRLVLEKPIHIDAQEYQTLMRVATGVV